MKTSILIKVSCLVILLSLITNSIVIAQWTQDGNNIYYNTGNVGIGITNLTRPLVVQARTDGEAIEIHGRPDGCGTLKFTNADGSRYANILHYNDHIILDATFGNVGIGTTTPSRKLEVNGAIQTAGLFKVSDARLKKSIIPIDSALDKVAALHGVKFEWRKEEFPERELEEGRKIGLIAQEVEQVLPEVVSTDEEGYKSVEYDNIVAVLVEAVKELKAQNDELRARIEVLESR